jgi:hypothetical protein
MSVFPEPDQAPRCVDAALVRPLDALQVDRIVLQKPGARTISAVRTR